MTATPRRFEFECPKCGATPGKHGKGGDGKCKAHGHLYGHSSTCGGIVCNCDFDAPGYDEPDHGETHTLPCSARCYHRDWEGRLPQLPKKMQEWEKRALASGWTPPDGWCKTPVKVVD